MKFLLQKKKSGFYILPNLFTTAGLFAGFYAIVAALKGHFETAAIAIFIAMILDGTDGRIARLTNTTSPFGAEYDSLADMVSFGIAPALVVYSWSLAYLGKLGWVAAFIFAAAVALRLARFNTQTTRTDRRFFLGLPSPAGAGVLAGTVWIAYYLDLQPHSFLDFIVLSITLLAGLLMVSEVRYYSFKDFNLQGRVPFIVILVIILIIVMIALQPPIVLFSFFSLYLLSGIIFSFYRWKKKKKIQKHYFKT